MAARKDRPAPGSSLHGSTGRAGAGSATPARPGSERARGRSGGSRTTGDPRDAAAYTRPALAPSLLAAVVLVACLALIDSGAFVAVRWGVTVLALIVLVFTVRGRAWWAAVLMAAVAVLWNPVLTIGLPGELWAALQLVAAVVFVVVGITAKVPREAEASRASRSSGRS